MLKIRLYGDPALRRKAEPILEVTDELRNLAQEMLVTMYRDRGIGLAAPQVGVSKRLIVVDPHPDEGSDRPLILINPEIVELENSWVAEEGCLSFPDIYAEVARAESVVVTMTDLDGKEQMFTADGWLGRVIQHEIDHLNGVLFIDRISPVQRQLIRGPLRKLQKQGQSGITRDIWMTRKRA